MTNHEKQLFIKLLAYAAVTTDGAEGPEVDHAETMLDRKERLKTINQARAALGVYGANLVAGVRVDSPALGIYGGVIKKRKGRTAYVEIYNSHEGVITRRILIDNLTKA